MCVCVCVPRAPHGGLSDTSALEISSGGGSGLNSLPVRIRTGVRTLRSPAIGGYLYVLYVQQQYCLQHVLAVAGLGTAAAA